MAYSAHVLSSAASKGQIIGCLPHEWMHQDNVSGVASLACRLHRAFVSKQQVSAALHDGLLWLLVYNFSHAIVILNTI